MSARSMAFDALIRLDARSLEMALFDPRQSNAPTAYPLEG
jgi:hypothetical protein